MVSIICVYNNRQLLQECLIKSIEEQDEDCEMVLVDNTKGDYPSAAAALNYGADKASSQYLIFAHQDIIFIDKGGIKKIEEFLNNSCEKIIVGVAGKIESDIAIYGNIFDNNHIYFEKLANPTKAVSVDECLFAMEKTVFQQYRFDELICNNWHFYAAEFSYRVRLDNIQTYIIPIDLHHNSVGNSMNIDFYYTLDRLCKKYKTSYKKINTTCCYVNTLGLISYMQRNHWKLRARSKLYAYLFEKLKGLIKIFNFSKRKK